jgi:hypothetical protein
MGVAGRNGWFGDIKVWNGEPAKRWLPSANAPAGL